MQNDKPDPVVLHSAYWWECPTCGREHMGKMPTAELTDHDRADVTRTAMGLEPWQPIPEDVGIDLVTMPERVECAGCEGAFPVFNEG